MSMVQVYGIRFTHFISLSLSLSLSPSLFSLSRSTSYTSTNSVYLCLPLSTSVYLCLENTYIREFDIFYDVSNIVAVELCNNWAMYIGYLVHEQAGGHVIVGQGGRDPDKLGQIVEGWTGYTGHSVPEKAGGQVIVGQGDQDPDKLGQIVEG